MVGEAVSVENVGDALLTVSEALRLVSPSPVVVLSKMTVSVLELGASVDVLAARLAVTVMVAPAARVPLLDERVNQVAAFAAVQFKLVLPVLARV
jgi:hypothetical protein